MKNVTGTFAFSSTKDLNTGKVSFYNARMDKMTIEEGERLMKTKGIEKTTTTHDGFTITVYSKRVF